MSPSPLFPAIRIGVVLASLLLAPAFTVPACRPPQDHPPRVVLDDPPAGLDELAHAPRERGRDTAREESARRAKQAGMPFGLRLDVGGAALGEAFLELRGRRGLAAGST